MQKSMNFSSNTKLALENADESSSSVENQKNHTYDILTSGLHKVIRDAVLNFTKERKNPNNQITEDTKMKCKVLKFDKEWKFNEILEEITRSHSHAYHNLFLLIMNVGSFKTFKSLKRGKKIVRSSEELKKILDTLSIFYKNRLMVLQITSKLQGTTRIYYKEQKIQKFFKMKQYDPKTYDFFDFPSFISVFLKMKTNGFEDFMINKLPNIENSELIIRFLRILPLSEKFFEKLVLKCAECGKVSDFLAAVDSVTYNSTKRIDEKAVKYIACSIESFDKSNESKRDKKESFSENEDTDEEESDELNKSINSVLLKSLNKPNQEIINFLVGNCSHLLQELPYNCQVAASNLAIEKNPEILCDLLDYCDFPFPRKPDLKNVENDRLKEILTQRREFHKAIAEEDYSYIDNYISNNPNHKVVHSSNNVSALYQAVDSKKYKMLYNLKSRGFHVAMNEDEDLFNGKEDEEKQAYAFMLKQRKENVNKAYPNSRRTIMLLSSRSFIHNIRISKNENDEYQNQIREWYESIYRIEEAVAVLDTVASCNALKIIYDFESETTSCIDIKSYGSLGQLYAKSKWIFIAAKKVDRLLQNREQEIKGVIAHEFCHYAMRLGYGNNEHPYFKDDYETKGVFDEIVRDILEMLKADKYDNCDGIISSTYMQYEKEDLHPELIVRVVQILVTYANNRKKVAKLREKYKNLFDFFIYKVTPHLKKLNFKVQDDIRLFNKISGQLTEMNNSKYTFSTIKFPNLSMIKSLLTNCHRGIVTTNIPFLMQLAIYKNFQTELDNLIDVRTIFVDSKNLREKRISDELNQILRNSTSLNIIINCATKFECGELLKKFKGHDEVYVTFIVSNKMEIEKTYKEVHIENLDFKWSNLSQETQLELLKSNIKFQKKLIMFCKLILDDDKMITLSKTVEKKGDDIVEDISEKLKDEVLKNFAENQMISINEISVESENEMKNFNILFLARKFIRLEETTEEIDVEKEDKFNPMMKYDTLRNKITPKTITQKQMLDDVDNQKYVLIVDMAGTGKSWVIKSIFYIKIEQDPYKWTTRVDLKQYIEDYKLFLTSFISFEDFMVKIILKKSTIIEKEVFKHMYKIGKVCILFDAFDEISPNYTEFIRKTIKSFESFGGNQLWIATRDLFRDDLQKELELKVVYKLEPFTFQNGIDLMTKYLVFNDLKTNNEIINENDIQKEIRNHRKYKIYQKKAIELSKMIFNLDSKAIGAPQVFTMIADIHRCKSAETSVITIFNIFNEFVKIYYKMWAFEKGEIRRNASILSQKNILNFMGLHEYYALKTLYPNLCVIYRLVLKHDEWPETEIVACGLLLKRNNDFQFQHELFREFFIVQFIIRILEIDGNNIIKEFSKLLCDVMTSESFQVARVFLNEYAIKHEYFSEKLPKIVKNVKHLNYFGDIVRNNLDNLRKIWMDYFKSLKYKNLKKILLEDKKTLFKIAEDIYLCRNFKKFPYILLETNDLLKLFKMKDIHGRNIIHCAVSNDKLDIVETIIGILKKKLGSKLGKILLSNENQGRNLLQIAAIISKDVFTFEYLWNYFQSYFNSNEKFLTFLKQVDNQGNNIFILASCFSTPNLFNFMIKKIEKFASKEEIQELLGSIGFHKRNLLQAAVVLNKSKEFHNCLWKTIRKYFDSKNIFEMLINTDSFDTNLLHYTVIKDDPEILEIIWKEITATLKPRVNVKIDSTKLNLILESKGHYKLNLLQQAARWSKDIKIHRFLWIILADLIKSKPKFIWKIVFGTGTIIHVAARFNTEEICCYTWKETIKHVNTLEDQAEYLGKIGRPCKNTLKKCLKMLKNDFDVYVVAKKLLEEYELGCFVCQISFCSGFLNRKNVIIEKLHNSFSFCTFSCKSTRNPFWDVEPPAKAVNEIKMK